jgi:HSP20 family molecular chaperone IbpA
MQENRRWSRERDQWVVQGYVVWRTNRHFVPPTDVIELADKILVVVEIAGMRPNDFTVSLANRQLVISGTRERPALTNAAYHQVEIGYGDFRVEVQLSHIVERDEVTAMYRDGFLHVELPRRSDGQQFLINVNTEERDER